MFFKPFFVLLQLSAVWGWVVLTGMTYYHNEHLAPFFFGHRYIIVTWLFSQKHLL